MSSAYPETTADETLLPAEGDAPADAARVRLRAPRRAWKSLPWRTRERIGGAAVVAVIAAVVAGVLFMAFGYPAVRRHNDRVQAVQRAMKMDGEVFTVTDIGWNWIGDTRLHLRNARGEDAGWIMIYSSNPLHKEINPFYLAFTPKRDDPLPLPMKVRAHYRAQPWVEKIGDREYKRENFTGSFLEFEVLAVRGEEVASR